MMRWGVIGAAAMVVACGLGNISPAAGEVGKGEEQSASIDIPCGVSALFVLCRLEGKVATLPSVSAVLPDHGDGGHSLAELRNAARELKFPLRGVRIDRTDWPLDRPALVHLDRKPHGHFVVIRPVGHSGSLAQIIDGIDESKVVEAAELFASPEWTGAALVPERGRGARAMRHAAMAGIVLFLGMGVYLAERRKRRRIG